MIASFRVGLCLLAAIYCAACLLVLETRDQAVPGGVLKAYHAEYSDGGSKKWRFPADGRVDYRKPLYDFITTFGIAVYPVGVIGILLSLSGIFSGRPKGLFILTFIVCFAVLCRFIMLGVATAALPL